MNDRLLSQPSLPPMSISAVERDTGISKDTLRVWERRYGYPTPERDSFGERTYSPEQVDKLRLLRRLLDQGHRPGRIINLGIEKLSELAQQLEAGQHGGEAPVPAEPVSAVFELIRGHRIDELRRELSQLVLRLGIHRFVNEVAAPLNRAVGEAWARGSLEIFEEHLYTESMQVVMRNAISSIPSPGRSPQILLTTFPNEPHGLGLLMAEALMALEDCQCISLGCEMPVNEILRAARAQSFDVVALSFTNCQGVNPILDGLADLRSGLPETIRIWAGGYCPALQRKQPDGIRVMMELDEIAGAVAEWRAENRA
ncbi:MAG: MerR family transcriptional regulator [Burkholderiaceae bacterium]